MDGVLFDLDGVITDTARFHFAAWRQLAQQAFGVSLPDSFEAELKGISRESSLQRIVAFAQLDGQYTVAQLAALATQKNENYVAAIKQLTAADILPGIQPLLVALKARGVPMVIASASKNAPLILDRLALSAYFTAIVNPNDVHQGKPAPDIFIAAAQKIAVDPRKCVGLEDSVAGVAAINAAGAVSVAIGHASELSAAAVVVPTTAALTADLLEQAFEQYQH